HQLALALFQLGNDVGEVGDDALGILVGIKQNIDFSVVGEGGQGVQGVAGVAVPCPYAVADRFGERLGKQAAEAAERVGGLEGGLVHLALEPAVVDQVVEDPAGLLTVIAEAALLIVIAVEQRRPLQRLAEYIQHLL